MVAWAVDKINYVIRGFCAIEVTREHCQLYYALH